MLLSYCSQFGSIPNQLHSRTFKCQQRPSTVEAEVLVCAKASLFSRKRSLFSIATEFTNRMHPCIRSATFTQASRDTNMTDTHHDCTNLKQSPQSHWTGYTAGTMSREGMLQRHACSGGAIVAIAIATARTCCSWGQLSSPRTVSCPFRQVVDLLQFMTGESLQHLYHQLFGADDENEDDTSLVTTDALQEFNSHLQAATQPMAFEKPAGLHLFQNWTSQQQQVRVSALCPWCLPSCPPL